MSWTQPICEADWIAREGDRVPHRMVAEHAELEICAFCGQLTRWGAYVRADPATVPYPALEKK